MKVLPILNDPPYGTERSYNGLRLAEAVAKTSDTQVRVFLIGDAVGCAMANQKVPDGWYQPRPNGELDCAARRRCRLLRHLPGRQGHTPRPAHQGRPPVHPRSAFRVDAVGRQGRDVLTRLDGVTRQAYCGRGAPSFRRGAVGGSRG